MESASSQELDRLEEKIRAMNPEARILKTHYSLQEDPWYFSLLERSLTGEIRKGSDLQADPENLGLTDVSLQSPDQLLLFVNGLVSGVFGNICRSKGYLKAGESWFRFDTADRTYSLTGCAPAEDSRAVFIGRELKRSWLREVLQQEITVVSPKFSGRRIRR